MEGDKQTDDKVLLTKTMPTLLIEYRKGGLVPTWRLHPYRVLFIRRYSACSQRREVNPNPATNPAIYKSGLPAKSAGAVRTQSLWE